MRGGGQSPILSFYCIFGRKKKPTFQIFLAKSFFLQPKLMEWVGWVTYLGLCPKNYCFFLTASPNEFPNPLLQMQIKGMNYVHLR